MVKGVIKIRYELMPTDNRKSFYGKAVVDGDTLYSYGTKIMTKNADGTFTRQWAGWSATRRKRGVNKKGYMEI